MSKVTFIVPIYSFNDKAKEYLSAALKSVDVLEGGKHAVIVAGYDQWVRDVEDSVKADKLKNIEIQPLMMSSDSPFELINEAAKLCLTEYFSVLDPDGRYYAYWATECAKYMEEYPNSAVYMPIVELFNEKREFCGLMNEVAWSTSFSGDNENLGYLDKEELKTFMDFNVTGSIISVGSFLSVGGLKPSLKIAAWYEFLMRLAHNYKDIYVVPKIGYAHTIGIEGSYNEAMSKEIDAEYGRWLIETAQTECEYNEERDIVYQQD